MKSVLYCIIILSFFNVFERRCSNFKSGSFKYKNTDYHEWTFIRNDTLQIEENSASGVIIYSKIEWLTDCKYKLICTKVDNSTVDDSEFIGTEFITTIYDTSNSSYKCRTSSTLGTMEFEIIKTK
ncbi:hypothetical protein [Psychroserpens damuponensis]|uniref:hypothetical protein n=1 Tax=Psychroserpens damuponensis TaxID=943936 RepID=UPI00058EBB18|nr:hypothetical protein [Psychroserpens damuponensis]